jgi:DNA-binding NarL/FixJ family response regulator
MHGNRDRLVVIGDQRPIVGASLAALLNSRGYVAMATSQVDIVIKEASTLGADLAIVATAEPLDDVLHLLRDGRASGYGVPVLVVVEAADAHVRREVLLAGARAVLSRALPTETFLAAVARLCDGESVLPGLDEPAAATLGMAGRWPQLTTRELDILRGLASGRTTSELAAQFGLRSATVRTYVQRVLMKLGVHSRPAAVAAAVRAGVARPAGFTPRSAPPPAGPGSVAPSRATPSPSPSPGPALAHPSARAARITALR